ncbi:hypothetical protein QUA51_09390 [Microcoleus sp. Pol10_D6]|uniref:hypothetical protein n=1 Tax=unclassified Microcoleus TaxID=2642155 RepID=UPI002FD72530
MFSEKIVTPEQIALYREQLADNQDALDALDVIEEYGKISKAAKAIAIQEDIEGVIDNAGLDWFDEMLQKCRNFICKPQYENLREKYIPALIPPLADCIAGVLACPPGVAGIIATPFAIYVAEEGMDKFCQPINPQP